MALAMLLPLTFVALVLDVSRHYIASVQEWFSVMFGWLLRRHESDSKKKRLNGATYVLVSATLCVLIFPKPITITAFSILILGDMMAALIGRRFGRHRFFDKSVEGSLAFFAIGIAVIVAVPQTLHGVAGILLGILAVGVGAVVEALPWEVDDNLSPSRAASSTPSSRWNLDLISFR